ncbi:DUF1003 domain-containing protein [Cellulomonas hominis]
MPERLDAPKESRRSLLPKVQEDAFGKISEGIARFMGTPRFLAYLSLFCLAWILWNSWGPEGMRFDKASNGFTALTLMLSLQASYAAPLILLAQNRQTDRDRVTIEQDRQRAERNLADTEFLAREMAALRIALSEVATRDFVRSELRNLLEDLTAERDEDDEPPDAAAHADQPSRGDRARRADRTDQTPGPTDLVP